MDGRLQILLAAVLWSTGGLFIKVLLGSGHALSPGTLVSVRSLAAGLVLAWALPRLRKPVATAGHDPTPVKWTRVAAPAVVYAAFLFAYVSANVWTSAANAILLQYFYPLIVAVVSFALFGERLVRGDAWALGLGTLGVVVIVVGSWQGAEVLGVTLGMLSALGFGAFVLLQRPLKGADVLALTSINNLVTFLAILPFADGILDAPPAALALVAFQGVVQIAAPYVLFLNGLRTVPAVAGSVITLAEPLLNPLWTWLGVGEVPSFWTLLGGGVLLAALVVQAVDAARRRGRVARAVG